MSRNPKDNDRPLVRLEMYGDVQFPVCATCAQLYMGELSERPEVKDNVTLMVENATRAGESVVVFQLPEIEYRPLRPAITIGQSVYDREITSFIPDSTGTPVPTTVLLDQPRPVCWVHLQGFKPEKASVAGNGVSRNQSTAPTSIIAAKAHKKVTEQ